MEYQPNSVLSDLVYIEEPVRVFSFEVDTVYGKLRERRFDYPASINEWGDSSIRTARFVHEWREEGTQM